MSQVAATQHAPSGDGSTRSTPGTARIMVLIDGFRDERGHALLALFREGKHFPGEPEKATRRFEAAIEQGRARFVIDDVPPGELAFSVLHDEDDDKKLKTNWFGIPKEGLGFSRNPRVRFGPPSFDDAKLKVEADTAPSVTIHVRYY